MNNKIKICVDCGQEIDEEVMEFDVGYDKGKNTIYMCEESLDYSTKNMNFYEYKNNTKRLNKFNKGN